MVHTGLAMVEMAFWDIIGKATNQPFISYSEESPRQNTSICKWMVYS